MLLGWDGNVGRYLVPGLECKEMPVNELSAAGVVRNMVIDSEFSDET